MKKLMIAILAFLCFLPCFAFDMTYADNINDVYIVTANNATIFSEPDFASTKLKQIQHKTEVLIELENEIAKEYKFENFIFYKVTYEEFQGYIFADLLVPKNEIITAIPNFNAKTNSDCKVFLLEDNKIVESQISLPKNERIFLYEGFQSKKEYTAIAFVFQNQVLYGYLETKNVSPDGINPIIIYSIIVIIALLGIIFAWLFMKNKKVKIKKKNLNTENN